MKNIILSLSTILVIMLSIGCSEDEPTNQAPTCTITSPDNGEEIQQGQTVTISVDADDTDGTVTEVRFYVDGTGVGSSNSFPYNYDWSTSGESTGSHTLKATAKDNSGVPTSDEIAFFLTDGGSSGNEPVAAFTANKTEITEGSSITFTDQSTNEPTGWAWNFGDGGTSTKQHPSHSYNTQGTYTVSLTVANSFGNDTETKTNYITVTTNTVTDYEGNTYQTVTIGTQIWMAENLKTTHYPSGARMTLVTDNTAWAALGDNDTDDAYCYYENNSSRGALYTYAAALDACPAGWHLPSDEEWTTLETHISNNGHDGTEGTALKATRGWNSSGNGTDNYGFSALPGGRRNYSGGTFGRAGGGGYWWSSTESSSTGAYHRRLLNGYAGVNRSNTYKSSGFSVRCLRDN